MFDLLTGQSIGNCPNSWIPHFLEDNKTLIAVPESYLIEPMFCFKMDGALLRQLPDSWTIDTNCERVLGANMRALLSYKSTASSQIKMPDWLPAFIANKLHAWIGKKNYTLLIQSRDTSTKQLLEEFKVQVKDGVAFKISPDCQWLAMQETDQLSLWHIPPQPSHLRWLVCCILAVMAMCLAWPRRSDYGVAGGSRIQLPLLS